MVKRLVTLVALLLVVIPGVSVAQAASAPTAAVSAIGGGLLSESTTGGATTLVISTTHYGQVTVNISSTTTFVRRYNGVSALDELSLHDFLAISGSFAAGSTTVFNATRVKDFTIQEAATRAVLLVTKVSTTTTTMTGSFTGLVLRDAVSRLRPFDEGAPLTVTVSISGTSPTKVQMWANGKLMPATFANIRAGQKVTILGVYNRRQRTYIQTLFVHIH